VFRKAIALLLVAACSAHAFGQGAPLADPMRPALRGPGAAGQTGAQALRLAGIVVSPSRRLALIDGEFLEEGQRIYDVQVVRIDKESVTVRRDGKSFVLRPETAATQAEEPGESL